MDEVISLKIDNEEIVFADLTGRENLEVVAVCKSGNIFLFDLNNQEKRFFGKLSFNSIPDLLADYNPFHILQELSSAELKNLLENIPSEVESVESIIEKNPKIIEDLPLNLKLHSFQDYVCFVQKNVIFGTVINLADPNYQKNLERGDYCAEVSLFPIAFYSKENQTYLIHGTDWNRLDITCLETEELFTGRTVDYESNSNYFDYFHSSLIVSPDAKHFISNGWIWHPFGQITL